MIKLLGKTSAFALVLGAAGLMIPGAVLSSGPGDFAAPYEQWEEPILPETVTSAPITNAEIWTDFDSGNGATGETTGLLAGSSFPPTYGPPPAPAEPAPGYAPYAPAQTAVLPTENYVVPPVTNLASGGYEFGDLPVADATTSGSHSGAFPAGGVPFGGPIQSQGVEHVDAVSVLGSRPVPLHQQLRGNLQQFTSPLVNTPAAPDCFNGSFHPDCGAYVAPTPVVTAPVVATAPVFTPPVQIAQPVFQAPQVIHHPPQIIQQPPQIIQQPPQIVERPVYVDRPVEKVVFRDRPVDRVVFRDRPVDRVVYRDRPVDRVVYRDRPVDRVVYRDRPVEKLVYRDRPVYVNRRIVMDRPVYVNRPYPVDRPVYVDRKVPVPVHIRQPVPVDRPVYVEKRIPVPVPRPVPVHIDRPVPVHIDRPVPVHIDRPVHVDRPVYIEKRVPVDRAVYVPRPVPVPVPRPVPVHVDRPVYVEKRVPVPHAVPVHIDRPVVYEKRVPYPVERHVKVPVPFAVPTAVHTPIVTATTSGGCATFKQHSPCAGGGGFFDYSAAYGQHAGFGHGVAPKFGREFAGHGFSGHASSGGCGALVKHSPCAVGASASFIGGGAFGHGFAPQFGQGFGGHGFGGHGIAQHHGGIAPSAFSTAGFHGFDPHVQHLSSQISSASIRIAEGERERALSDREATELRKGLQTVMNSLDAARKDGKIEHEEVLKIEKDLVSLHAEMHAKRLNFEHAPARFPTVSVPFVAPPLSVPTIVAPAVPTFAPQILATPFGPFGNAYGFSSPAGFRTFHNGGFGLKRPTFGDF